MFRFLVSQRSPLLSCWNFKKTTETDMLLRCKGMCWEQCSQFGAFMCEAEWKHAEKSFMKGQTTASDPSLRFSYNSQLTLMLLSAVLYPKFEDISWDMWLFHSSDSSNHNRPTERPSFCNWYGKYQPGYLWTSRGSPASLLDTCLSMLSCHTWRVDPVHVLPAPSRPAAKVWRYLWQGEGSTGQVELKWVQPKMSCFKRVIRDSLLRSKVYARTTQLQHVDATCTKCNVEGQAMWTTRPNFWTFQEKSQKFARFGISSNFGGHWNL